MLVVDLVSSTSELPIILTAGITRSVFPETIGFSLFDKREELRLSEALSFNDRSDVLEPCCDDFVSSF